MFCLHLRFQSCFRLWKLSRKQQIELKANNDKDLHACCGDWWRDHPSAPKNKMNDKTAIRRRQSVNLVFKDGCEWMDVDGYGGKETYVNRKLIGRFRWLFGLGAGFKRFFCGKDYFRLIVGNWTIDCFISWDSFICSYRQINELFTLNEQFFFAH